MKNIFFIKSQNNNDLSWNEIIEAFSLKNYAENYDQQMSLFERTPRMMIVEESEREDRRNLLHISLPMPITIKDNEKEKQFVEIELAFIAEKLKDQKYDCIFFGAPLDDTEIMTSTEILFRTTYYARNKETGFFENLITEKVINDGKSFQSIIWLAVYNISNTNFYNMVLNTNLVFLMDNLKTFSFNNEIIKPVSIHDGNIKRDIFLPSIEKGVFIGENLIYTKENSFTINLLGGGCLYNYSEFKSFSEEDIPELNVEILTDLKYNKNKNILTVDMENKEKGYLIIRWLTGTNYDKLYFDKDMLVNNDLNLIREFIIFKN